MYRFLNSGGYIGAAGDLAKMLEAALALADPVWTSKDDQSVYSMWYIHAAQAAAANRPLAAPPITLDHCHNIFAVLSGEKHTANFDILKISSDGSFRHQITGTHPIVAHLPGRSKRFSEFLERLP